MLVFALQLFHLNNDKKFSYVLTTKSLHLCDNNQKARTVYGSNLTFIVRIIIRFVLLEYL
jgi:hypothetical protein